VATLAGLGIVVSASRMGNAEVPRLGYEAFFLHGLRGEGNR